MNHFIVHAIRCAYHEQVTYHKRQFNFNSAMKLHFCIDNIIDKRANWCFYKTYSELEKKK